MHTVPHVPTTHMHGHTCCNHLQETAKYVSDFGKFRLYTGLLLGTSYLLVFVLLVVIYSKTLRYVRDTREPARNIEDSLIASIYGAKRRVIYFIGAFIVCGFASEWAAVSW